jgi:dipeptidyl aminopeptidase/acylaminoacyl peptidase
VPFKVFGEATTYTTTERSGARFPIIHGTADDVVDPATQSRAFQNVLNQAGIYVRRFVIPAPAISR